jgi:hypothetical protein
VPVIAGRAADAKRSTVRPGSSSIGRCRGVVTALGRVLADQLFARRLGQAGRKAVETYCNWDRVMQDLREIEAQVA